MDSHVSREAVIEAISDELDKIDHVPQWVYDRLINRIKMLESAESREFEWCTDCKEYDKEKHCCHRYSKVIRQAVEEMKLVHCIDCQHSEYDEVYKDRYCHYNGKAEVVGDYHYCRDGEKKGENPSHLVTELINVDKIQFYARRSAGAGDFWGRE